jgi:hypothetical protein
MAETRDILKELMNGFNKVTFENENSNVSLTLDNVILEDFESSITVAPESPTVEEIRITLRRFK